MCGVCQTVLFIFQPSGVYIGAQKVYARPTSVFRPCPRPQTPRSLVPRPCACPTARQRHAVETSIVPRACRWLPAARPGSRGRLLPRPPWAARRRCGARNASRAYGQVRYTSPHTRGGGARAKPVTRDSTSKRPHGIQGAKPSARGRAGLPARCTQAEQAGAKRATEEEEDGKCRRVDAREGWPWRRRRERRRRWRRRSWRRRRRQRQWRP